MAIAMRKEEIKKILKKHGFQVIEIHDSIGSTNDRANELCSEKEIDLGIVITDDQTSGRGRGMRKWEMGAGSGLAISIILGKIDPYKNILGRVTGVGSLAVVRAVEKLTELSPMIKWPNDVLIDGRKFCGILTEASWIGHDLKSLIIGIGVNISEDVLLDNSAFPATALEKESNEIVDPVELLDLIIFNLLGLIEQIYNNQIIAEWEDYLVYRNQEIQIFKDSEILCSGILLGLDDDGGVVVETIDNQKRIFYYGDIHLAVKLDDG